MSPAAQPSRRPRRPGIATVQDITLAHLQARTLEEGDCLIWQGYLDHTGNPHWRIGGKARMARRVLWELAHGPIPPGRQVGAGCGVRGCVCPDHLVCRTRSKAHTGRPKTMAHRISSALAQRARPGGKLNAQSAADIRSATGETHAAIAARHGVSESLVWRIRRGQAWRDYSNPFAGLLAR